MRVELMKSFQFEAAHANLEGGRAQLRTHGHSYRVDLRVEGDCDEKLGWLIDYADISDAFDPLYRQLDHFHLNDVEGLFDVTTDGIGNWIAERLRPGLPMLKSVTVTIVGDCSFLPERSPGTIAFTFESAHFLPELSPAHKCSRLHGHSFRVEIAARNPATENAKTIFSALDHQTLNEIEGLENPTSEQISRWIWNRLEPDVQGLNAVTVAETCTAQCIYRGD